MRKGNPARAAAPWSLFSTFKMPCMMLGDLCLSRGGLVRHPCCQLLEAAMGKAGKAAAKKEKNDACREKRKAAGSSKTFA